MIDYENPWTYQGQDVTIEMLAPYAGFVYLIEDTRTRQLYIGKKFVWSHRKVKGKTRRQRFESDWRKYYSSHDGIKKAAKTDPMRFRREILHLCVCEGEANWKELDEIIKRNALWDENYLNENLLGKYFRKNVERYYK